MAPDGAQAVNDLNKSAIQIPPVTYDPALIESIVRRRVDAAADTDAVWISPYRDELNDIYESPEQERSTVFAALDRRYFNRIGVPTVVDECLNERADALAGAASISLIAAQTRSEEGVDVTRDRQVVLRYRPAAFDHVDRFRANLRRELIQAADCFNPSFGHTPELLDGLMPSEKERIRAAISIMWTQSAEGRLQTGESDRPTFREMFDICKTRHGSQAVATGICDLCSFPSEDAVFLRALAPDICGALKSEFPHLRDTAQICARCAERTSTNGK